MLEADKIFARQFTPFEGGYLFYPFAWSCGYFVTEEEFLKLCEDRKRSLSFTVMLKWLLPTSLVSVLVLAVIATVAEDQRVSDIGTLGIGLALVAVILWKSTSASRLVLAREPVAPRRTKVERDRDTARIVGWPMMGLSLALSVWFVILGGMIAYAVPVVGLPLLAFFGFACVRNIQVAWRKYTEGIRSP